MQLVMVTCRPQLYMMTSASRGQSDVGCCGAGLTCPTRNCSWWCASYWECTSYFISWALKSAAAAAAWPCSMLHTSQDPWRHWLQPSKQGISRRPSSLPALVRLGATMPVPGDIAALHCAVVLRASTFKETHLRFVLCLLCGLDNSMDVDLNLYTGDCRAQFVTDMSCCWCLDGPNCTSTSTLIKPLCCTHLHKLG